MTKVFFISGAGLSAESGIPTFRTGEDGLWMNYDLDKVCNFATWQQNYDLVHEFYSGRRTELANYEPNEMHKAIAAWQKEFGKENVINVTTNVDDLLERAGVEDVVHLHGNLTKIVNVTSGEETDIGYTEFDTKTDPVQIIKPSVIFFGEHAPEYNTLSGLTTFEMGRDDIVVFIGMSFQVVPAKMCLPWGNLVKQPQTINVNPDKLTQYDHDWDLHLDVPCTQAISRLDNIIRSRLSSCKCND